METPMRTHARSALARMAAAAACCLLLCGCQACRTACRATSTYCVDRTKDFFDSFTLCAETGNRSIAVQFAGYPFGWGDGEGRGCGLRSGKLGTYSFSDYYYWMWGNKAFLPDKDPRGKGYTVDWEWLPSFPPFPFGPPIPVGMPGFNNPFGGPNRVEWQFEASVGVRVIGLRAGFNLGEFVDFLFGFVGADIMQDDTKAVQMREASKPAEEEAKVAEGA